MQISFDPPQLEDELDPVLREIVRETADQMALSRCALHGAAPEQLIVRPGSGGNLVDLEINGCCEEYEVPDED
jgi:hypothetical protein